MNLMVNECLGSNPFLCSSFCLCFVVCCFLVVIPNSRFAKAVWWVRLSVLGCCFSFSGCINML
jgi:hypothetical protein